MVKKEQHVDKHMQEKVRNLKYSTDELVAPSGGAPVDMILTEQLQRAISFKKCVSLCVHNWVREKPHQRREFVGKKVKKKKIVY